MPRIVAKTADVIARVRTELAASGVADVDAETAAIAKLVEDVDTRAKGTLSKSEVVRLMAQDAAAGAHVAKAYELITGKTIEPPKTPSLADQLPPDWRAALKDEIKKPYFQQLEKFVADERAKFDVLPPPDEVFAALKRTPLSKVSVVLLGQDPYPTKGNADGLSFSVDKGMPIPASLKNIFETAHDDVGTKVPNNGDLTPWADQGVLLLNTVLTVREGEPDSHKGHGWEQLTNAILDLVNRQPKRVAFLLLGKQAQAYASHVDTAKHVVIEAPHPSPMNPGNPFGKTHVFGDVNKALVDGGRTPIDWQIPDV